MAFAMDFNEEKQHNTRRRLNDSESRLSRLNAVELGYQSVAFVEPAKSVVGGLWDVIASDNRTCMGTFTTAELETATTRLLNRHSRHPWRPGQEKKYGDPALHNRKRRKSRCRKKKNRAN